MRRSTDDEHQPYSIEAQDARLAAYIGSQPGWRQAARFADDASGATTARPGLQRALAAARAGVIDVLLVYRVDRLTRSLRDLVTLLDDLDQAGVVFRSATEPFDTATAMGRMLVQMLGMFAQFERDTIIDRVIAGMERKAAAGKWKGGRRPFGYQADPATSSLVPDPAEAAVVRLIFELYTRDRLGARSHRAPAERPRPPDHHRRALVGPPGAARPVQPHLPRRADLPRHHRRRLPPGDHRTGHVCRGAADPGRPRRRPLQAGGERLRLPAHRADALPVLRQGDDRHPRARPQPRLPVLHLLHPPALRHRALPRPAAWTPTPPSTPSSPRWPASTGPARPHRRCHRRRRRPATPPGTRRRRAELAAAERELAKTSAAIDRYLAAFENGTLDPEDLAGRLAQLKARSAQLRARRDELAAHLAAVPAVAAGRHTPAGRRAHRRHHPLRHRQPAQGPRRSLIAQIKITGPDRIVPVFRIPQPPAHRPGLRIAADPTAQPAEHEMRFAQ